MNEKSMLEQIRRSAEEIEIPDALKPDAIEKMLREEQLRNTAQDKHGKKKWSRYARWGGRIAAALALCICAGAIFAVAGGRFGYVKDIAKLPVDNAKNPNTENVDYFGDIQENSGGDVVKEKDKALTLGESYYLAGDYGKVYDMLYAWEEHTKWSNLYGDDSLGIVQGGDKAEAEESMNSGADMAEPGSSEDTSLNESARGNDYSTTNVQTEGVDESDIVKTDGDYIYTLKGNKVVITDIRDNALTEIGTITPQLKSASDRVCEMYVDGDKLLLLTEWNENSLEAETVSNSSRMYADDIYYMDTAYKTSVWTYDISDRTKPTLLGEMAQDGSYRSSRKIGDKVYLFTNYQMDYDGVTKREALSENALHDWLPAVGDEVVGADCIYLPRGGESGLFMASMDVNEPEKAIDSKLIVNNCGEIYVSTDALYLYTTEYRDREITSIVKFELQDNGIIHAVNASSINGSVRDTFAVNEYNGYLRVLTTDRTRDGRNTNRLIILGKDMEYVSSIEDIAIDEQIYAARFLGDIGYFVTYRNTDPLFSVDLSDPYAPAIIGELKVTGFSEYLHRWDENHLIGIGYETHPNTGSRIGVKLSMFNISDPANVTEEARYVLYDEDDSSAMWNYKSVLISKDKNIIGFVTGKFDEGSEITYHAFSYADGTFTEELTVPSLEDTISLWNALDGSRSLYSGHTLYLIVDGVITAYDMENGYTELEQE